MKKSNYLAIVIISMFFGSCNNQDGEMSASGTFEANEIVISAEANGKILGFDLDEGMELEENQLVGYIDSIQLFLRKKQIQKNIQAIQSRHPEIQKQIAVIEQQIITQTKEKQRIENLMQSNAANQKQLDDINGYILVLEKQLEAQKSSLSITSKGIDEDISTLEVQIEQIDDQLRKCQIINPLKGTILAKYSEKNEIANIGKPLYKIADINNLIFRAYLTSGQLTKVKIGEKVKVYADFGDETKEYEGVIQWISSKSEFTPKTIQTRDERANLVYAIKIAVKNNGYLKIGMYGQIQLNAENNH